MRSLDYRLMGILNVTPDSFSDGGLFLDPGTAIRHGRALVAQGAQIVDVGGESTRPGAEPVSGEEESRRVIPVLEGLAQADPRARLSIDTSKLSVATAAIAAGATIVNDVTAFRHDPEMAGLVADTGCDCCLMHMIGDPATMRAHAHYRDVVDEVKAFLHQRISFAIAEGVPEERILIDPGIGFAKTVDHDLQLIARLDELTTLGPPIVIGTSRKSFLGRILSATPADPPRTVDARDRLAATIASNVLAFERGAEIFRVHDVGPVRDGLAVAAATLTGRWTPTIAPTSPRS